MAVYRAEILNFRDNGLPSKLSLGHIVLVDGATEAQILTAARAAGGIPPYCRTSSYHVTRTGSILLVVGNASSQPVCALTRIN